MQASRGRSPVWKVLALGIVAGPAAALPAGAESTESFETQSLVGSYLAGRFARNQHDSARAADFYRSALGRDAGNELLLEQAFQMEASQGNWPRAVELARELVAAQPPHRIANLFLGLSEFKDASYKKATEHFRAAQTGPIGELTGSLALAWVQEADGDVTSALDTIKMPKQAEWAQFYLRYHRALIADLAGRTQDARAAYELAFRQDTRTLRTALAYARHAARAGDRKLAKSILKEHLEKAQGEGHPLIRALRDDIDKGGKSDLIVASAKDGMAEVFYGLGEALISEGAVGIGVLYLQMALFVEPDHQFALAALANAHEANKLYAEAIATYDRIPSDSPLETAIEIRKAYNLNSLDRTDEARETLVKLLGPDKETPADKTAVDKPAPASENGAVQDEILKLGSRGDGVTKLQEALKALGYSLDTADGAYGDATRRAVMKFQAKNGMKSDGLAGPRTVAAILKTAPGAKPDETAPAVIPSSAGAPALTTGEKLEIYDALGSIMRSRKLYADAVGYYDRAIALIPKPERRHWSYYYARGTSYERLKNWPAAEVDLEKALALYPDQPLVLNYLGYSWIDQGRNMKEGMAHIEKAVALKPDDGYIVDSLGWAHFKQGNYKEAVRYLERAVELKPDDPVLNDHLGDALWRVGREREARFQWDQALSLKPEPEDVDKIKKKLEQGLSSASEASAVKTKQASQSDTAAKRN